jgi:hypothetical protein
MAVKAVTTVTPNTIPNATASHGRRDTRRSGKIQRSARYVYLLLCVAIVLLSFANSRRAARRGGRLARANQARFNTTMGICRSVFFW